METEVSSLGIKAEKREVQEIGRDFLPRSPSFLPENIGTEQLGLQLSGVEVLVWRGIGLAIALAIGAKSVLYVLGVTW